MPKNKWKLAGIGKHEVYYKDKDGEESLYVIKSGMLGYYLVITESAHEELECVRVSLEQLKSQYGIDNIS